ncbi:YheC/YheD family protein, partial [Heyndrickxia sporothermodurans]|uniref:YheC/YheD family protein n=1 Tax=Heyndrickxia sporothermodurans TaxID=46224 RepID=UPI002E1E8354
MELLAKLGLILALIQKKGNVWLFEANSKPGRSIFSHPNLREFDFLTRKLTLSYSIFLTERLCKLFC